ncbi:MAG: glycogen debranching enzyme N-terminal domain-containing protein [Desulfobacterales bacterium]|nr:MAG: glycogen debranching enzyme N-terminal domain-containing protein [Desulfobacterales bacterium]
MENSLIWQDPVPGKHLLKFRGDVVTFSLSLAHPQKGTAWVRTNIGQARTARREIIREVENEEPPLGRDWFDIPMQRSDDRCFRITLPLCEVGHFETKCFFLKERQVKPVWPAGGNTVVNVEPADTCCANIIYNAFVRQFGPNKSGQGMPNPSEAECIKTLDKIGYAVIPPSGTFRDLIRELDFILGDLGCRVLQLLPIHPTPTTFARMGRFGSPFAALSFTAVDPALAQFDPRATPLEQFIELVDAVHQRHGKIIIDIAINHTGWAARLHETHPEWLVRDPQGRIEVPGAWGVRWEDLTKLDYSHQDLWQYMADVFLTWCRRGVDGFRCDAGYMIPGPAWKYIIAKVRDQFPHTVFLLEGLGGKIAVTRQLLNTGNLNWAYSELFQSYDRHQIESYLPGAVEISEQDGILVHFAETHDNPRLAARSPVYARMRTALSALCSHQGAFGFANGVEWLATEKINVHGAPSLNWGAASNQVDLIRRLNSLLTTHPAFHDQCELKMVQEDAGNYLALRRHHLPSGKKLLVLANLDDENPVRASWTTAATQIESTDFRDLLGEAAVSIPMSDGRQTYLLQPGQVLCLTPDVNDLDLVRPPPARPAGPPLRIETQRLRAKALEVFSYYGGPRDLGDFDPDAAARQLEADPVAFCAALNPCSDESRVINWQWPRDLRREVMLPPRHWLLVRGDRPFRARLLNQQREIGHEESLPGAGGKFFALFLPGKTPRVHQTCTLKLTVYTASGAEHAEAALLVLPPPEDARAKRSFRRSEVLRQDLLFLDTNHRGGMLRIPLSWTKLGSRYDCLLAANPSREFPEDRWIMFTRCRAWLVFQGFSQEINGDCLDLFRIDDHSGGIWHYRVPSGQGEYVQLTVTAAMISGANALQLTFYRHPADRQDARLADLKPVELILRPDIESRGFHALTKAYEGPEHQWPAVVNETARGFDFAPEPEHRLQMRISAGRFVREPEWHYMVARPADAARGFDPHSDLFSPGYFSTFLEGGTETTLWAGCTARTERLTPPWNARHGNPRRRPATAGAWQNPVEVLARSLDHYVVKRGGLQTVIAGYPWFLDWGRDALIFVRGLVAGNQTRAARAILQQFGQFEHQGTLPNMIHGHDPSNRDTSDAPLWLLAACADLLRAEGTDRFLETPCGDRSIRQILLSIGQWFMAGTPNGIRMDPESGLIFSPAHFTWMDTDHPAGTPRQGYPIEIQALWHAALGFLSRIDKGENRAVWAKLGRQVQESVHTLFWREDLGFLADCLHARPGDAARQASPDDALRPNQLLALTLGAVSAKALGRRILAACEELLVPGAIRSLADREIRHPLSIVHEGKLLNDPHRPYQGTYTGDEDTQRKPAYHNGTAWTWLFPSFCEAWATVYGPAGHDAARAWLASSVRLLNRDCIGHIPEILDGDYPHTPRGCDAQAWGASELQRVWLKLAAGAPAAE